MKMTKEQVQDAIRSIHAAQKGPDEEAQAFCNRLGAIITGIEQGGWTLGLRLTNHIQHRALRGRKQMLRHPKRIWGVSAAFYNDEDPRVYVHYYSSDCVTKREALDRVARCPEPVRKQESGSFMTQQMYECMVQPRNYGGHIPGQLP